MLRAALCSELCFVLFIIIKQAEQKLTDASCTRPSTTLISGSVYKKNAKKMFVVVQYRIAKQKIFENFANPHAIVTEIFELRCVLLIRSDVIFEQLQFSVSRILQAVK